MTRNVQYSLFVGFCVVAFLVYSLTFTSSLFFDDVACLGGSGAYLSGFSDFFLAHSRWAVAFWNYLTLSCSGLSVEAFRIQNFMLHVLIAAAFLGVFNLVFEQMPQKSWIFRWRQWITLLASALFLLHPVQAQTALNVQHMRFEGLMVLSALVLCFLMINAIIYDRLLHRNGWFFAALVFSVFAVGTKESIVVTPLLIFFIDWFFIARGAWSEIGKRAWMYAIFGLVFYTAFFAINSKLNFWGLMTGRLSVFSKPGYLLTDMYQKPMSAYSYFLTQIPLVLHYGVIFFNPFDLCVDYDVSIITQWASPACIIAALAIILIVLGAGVAWYVERSNLVSFGIFWFFIALLPRITFVPSSDIVGDYKTFFASIGMMLLLAGVVCWVFEWLAVHVSAVDSKFGWAGIMIGLIWMSSTLLAITNKHCALWSDPIAFWEYVRVHTPNRARTAHNLGVVLANADRMSEAMECYHSAVRLDESYAHPLVRLGECYQRNGDSARALSYYLRAESVQLEPLPELHNNKGMLFFAQGDLARAESEFKKALAVEPSFAKGLFNYANLLKKLGRFTQGYLVINQCMRYSLQEDLPMHLLKARLAFEVRDFGAVITTLEPYIDKTSDISLQFMLASAYYSAENYKKAAEWFESVYNKRPDNLDVAYNYAQSLMKIEKYSSAVPYFQQCSGSDKYPFAPLHAAACLYRNGNYNAARVSIAALDNQPLLSEPLRAELATLKRDMHFFS